MNKARVSSPARIERLYAETEQLGFQMVSEPLAGSFLRTLAASKPHGDLLELGTGTGVSTGWLLDGMCPDSQLITVENDKALAQVAQKHLSDDPRISFYIEDAETVLERLERNGYQFDLIFADTWIGKYFRLERTLQLLKPGGLYIIDDMLPQPNWPEGHDLKVAELIETLEQRPDLHLTHLTWASGIIIATKQAGL
ncbi:MAG: class I SAM-dependent methyltransferase [Cyanobacteria bacterium J06643_4]